MVTEEILNIFENSHLLDEDNDDTDNMYKNMKKKARQWQTCAEEMEHQFDLLKTKYKKLKKMYKDKLEEFEVLKDKTKEREDQYQKHQLLMEKTILLKDTEIEKLSIQYNELKNKHNDVQTDFKEMKKRIYTISTQTRPIKSRKD